VTIGIGYDLQFVTSESLQQDWSPCLPPPMLTRLSTCTKKAGTSELVAELADITVPLFGAVSVFARRSLPKYWDMTRDIYPQVAQPGFPPARRTALVSLVFNRGARLQDKNPALQDRREMRTIQHHLATGNFDAVAGDLEAMARLWEGQNLGGLIQRRRDEATLWRSGFKAVNLE
jgi:hypothetical protein